MACSGFAAEPSSEALERKRRSLERLATEGFSISPDGALLPDSSGVSPRGKDEIAKRAVAICLTALKAERAEESLLDGLVKKYKAKKFFTPQEQDFMESFAPTNTDRTKYLRRYEGLKVLMWAAGYLDELGAPDKPGNVRAIVAPLSSRTGEQFLQEMKPRSAAELLDAADLNFRYEAAIMEARRKGQRTPVALDRNVVYERHYAFNWLLRYANLDWDQVSVDL